VGVDPGDHVLAQVRVVGPGTGGVVVLWRGRVVGELSRTSPEWHPSTLLRMAFGKADQGEETHV
jgi:hypothetical protein